MVVPAVESAPVDKAAVQSKIEELQKQLDALKQMSGSN